MKKRKIISITLSFALSASAVFGNAAYSQAKVSRSHVVSMYKKLLLKKKISVKGINGENNFTIQRNSDMTFTLVDVNKDGIPELYIGNTDSAAGLSMMCVLFYYSKEKIYALSGGHEGSFAKFAKGKVFLNSGSGMGDLWEKYYTFKNGRPVKLADSLNHMDLPGEKAYRKYYIGKKKVKKKKYDSYIKKITKNSKSYGLYDEKQYSLTDENLERYLK